MTKLHINSWIADCKAGFFISLIALPLCLGIATASGFPPFAGLITAIVGGVLVSWIGSARFTIKGPAAGLIVIVLGAVMELGQGEMLAGYHKALAVGVVAGMLQLVLALCRAAGLGIAMSKTVVHGMLAAIGIIIIAKQAHVMLGVVPEATGSIALLAEIPHSLMNMNSLVSLVGFASLFILLFWDKVAIGWLKSIPAPLVVLCMAVPLALTMGIDATYRVELPDSFLSGIAFPDFSDALTLTFAKYVLMFALVGAIESTLTVVAVDAMKDYKYPSDLNRDLLATSIGNIISSCIGGLPMISEIVRSKANIDAGAISQRANAAHGVFLLLYVVVLSDLIELIPLAALAAMLVVTGLRLASYKEVQHAAYIGKDQLLLFVITVVVTLFTDLLIGVTVGLLAKVTLHALRGVSPAGLFKARAIAKEREGGWTITIEGNAAFPCLLKVRNALREVDDAHAKIVIDVSNAKLVDYTFLSGLQVVFAEYPHMQYQVVGLQHMNAVGRSEFSTHIQREKTR